MNAERQHSHLSCHKIDKKDKISEENEEDWLHLHDSPQLMKNEV